MRKELGIVVACLVFGASTLAQSKPSLVGTWKLDVSQSDFGSDPAPKSTLILVSKDSPKMLSWRVREVDAKGKVSSYSWSGPEDGSMHPVMQNGKQLFKESAKKDDQGALLRHGESEDGSILDARATMSEEGNTVTDEITQKSKDGKETKEKSVYHRVAQKSRKPAS